MVKIKLPNKVIPFLSNDKDFHTPPPEDNLAFFGRPINCIIFGQRNVGKSRCMKNILARQNVYERIVIYTPLSDTNEYDDIDAEIVNDIPPLEFFDREVNNCFIIEDCDVKNDLTKDQRTLLGNYYRVYGSHYNIDLYTITQNPFDISTSLRRVANVVILFKNNDLDMLSTLCRKFNLKASNLNAIFETFTPYDFLVIDDTRPKEMRLRKNFFQIIEIS